MRCKVGKSIRDEMNRQRLQCSSLLSHMGVIEMWIRIYIFLPHSTRTPPPQNCLPVPPKAPPPHRLHLKFFLLIFFCRPCFIDTNSSNDLQVWLYWLLVICLADYIPEGQLTRNAEEDLTPKFSWAGCLSGLFQRKLWPQSTLKMEIQNIP